jgi:hypothetical protein
MTTVAADLRDVLALVYGRPTAPLVLSALVATGGLVLARRGRLLGWFTLWAAVLALPLAIPASADLLVARFISAEALWRVAYLGPLLLLTGVAVRLAGGCPLRSAGAAVPAGGDGGGDGGAGGARGEPSPFADPAMRFPSLSVKVAPERLAEARLVPGGAAAGEPAGAGGIVGDAAAAVGSAAAAGDRRL